MKRALIVDDDRQMVRTLCDILRIHGWEAVGVHSGEEAVAQIRGEAFSIVLMDVRMGGITGVEALRQIRRLRPLTQVVLMTAYSAAELLAEAEREGAVQILPKPVAIPGLITLLDAAVSGESRVLVVDDDPDYLSTVCDVLKQQGYVALRAMNLEEAIATLEEDSPAAVLLDLCLGEVEPGDAVLAIKRVSPAIALILYSGNGGALEQTEAALPSSYVNATLRKPFPPEQLLNLLHELISR